LNEIQEIKKMSDKDFLNDLLDLKEIILNDDGITKTVDTKYVTKVDKDNVEISRKILQRKEEIITHKLNKTKSLIYLNEKIDKLKEKISQNKEL
jgi:hypothetical protein